MKSPQQFPSDGNGIVLQRLHVGDDDLSQARMIDFCFIFPERAQALAFATAVDDKDKEKERLRVCFGTSVPKPQETLSTAL